MFYENDELLMITNNVLCALLNSLTRAVTLKLDKDLALTRTGQVEFPLPISSRIHSQVRTVHESHL